MKGQIVLGIVIAFETFWVCLNKSPQDFPPLKQGALVRKRTKEKKTKENEENNKKKTNPCVHKLSHVCCPPTKSISKRRHSCSALVQVLEVTANLTSSPLESGAHLCVPQRSTPNLCSSFKAELSLSGFGSRSSSLFFVPVHQLEGITSYFSPPLVHMIFISSPILLFGGGPGVGTRTSLPS